MVSNQRIPQLPKQQSMACWKYQHLPVVFCGVSQQKIITFPSQRVSYTNYEFISLFEVDEQKQGIMANTANSTMQMICNFFHDCIIP